MNRADERYRILLVEGRTADASAVCETLTGAGFAVERSSEAPSAVLAAGTQPYDLILTDLYPLGPDGPDGLDAARRIRKLPHPSGDVPILGMSDIPEDKDRCLAAGMDGLLVWPASEAQVLEAVSHWMEPGEVPTGVPGPRPEIAPPLVNRCTLSQLEEDVGAALLPDIMVTFLVETERRLGLLAVRVAAGDCTGAADEAHALKGAAGTFGAMALRQAAYRLELAGRAGDRERLGALLAEIERLAGETCSLLRTEFEFLAP
jgi:CheY-like chemotaxis protein/HPt (histidine-containing phosphotransfer) domain-containing protein